MVFLVVVLLIVLLLLGTPLYIFLSALSGYLFWQADIPLLSMVVSFQKLQYQEFVYAIPLFTFAGYLLSRSKSPERIIALVQGCFHFLPASASIVVVVIMALFTALTGASGVTILAMGGLLFPLLKKSSQNEMFSHGLITASGSIGLLLAPSLPVIIYTVIANQNVEVNNRIDLNTLFNNALIPSLVILIGFIGYSLFKEGMGGKEKYDFYQAKIVIKNAKWEIPLPLLVYGGIYLGFFTVLEAAIVVTFYTFFIVFVIHRDLTIKGDFVPITIDSLKLSGGIFIIMSTAFILTNYLVYERIPDKIFEWISPYLTNKLIFLIAINLLLLITGCFLDIFSAILIVLPLLLPVVERYQIDLYHFAIIFLINLEIGYLTPPVGLNLFISSYSFKKPVTYLYRTIIPFLIILLVILTMVTYLPSLSTTFSSSADVENQDDIPPIIEQIQIDHLKTDSVDLIVTTEQPVSSSTSFRVYYLDETVEEKDILLDFGEIREYNSADSDWTQKNDNQIHLRLTDLTPQTTYTVTVESVISTLDGIQQGLSSSLILFSTP